MMLHVIEKKRAEGDAPVYSGKVIQVTEEELDQRLFRILGITRPDIAPIIKADVRVAKRILFASPEE